MIDGDTLACGPDRVRLLGIDAPERSAGERAEDQAHQLGTYVDVVVYAGQRSTDHLQELVAECRDVYLTFDIRNDRSNHYDDYARLLAYGACNGQDLGELMLWDGWADLLLSSSSTLTHANTYSSAYADAVANARGMWDLLAPLPEVTRTNPDRETSMGGCFVRSLQMGRASPTPSFVHQRP